MKREVTKNRVCPICSRGVTLISDESNGSVWGWKWRCNECNVDINFTGITRLNCRNCMIEMYETPIGGMQGVMGWMCSKCSNIVVKGKRIEERRTSEKASLQLCPSCSERNWACEIVWDPITRAHRCPSCIGSKGLKKGKNKSGPYNGNPIEFEGTYRGPSCVHNQDRVKMGDYEVILSESPMEKWTRVEPELGVYMAEPWLRRRGVICHGVERLQNKVKHPAIFVTWPDRGVIKVDTLNMLVDTILSYLKDGKTVELGCWGGHGRTGTLAACVLGRLEGLDGPTAVRTLRIRYCNRAVEGKAQESLVATYLALCEEGAIINES